MGAVMWEELRHLTHLPRSIYGNQEKMWHSFSAAALNTMKSLLVMVATLSLAWGQEMHCHCATFVSTVEGGILMHNLPYTEVTDCDDFEGCESRCTKEFIDLTDGGDLDHELEDGNIVGQLCCDTAAAEGYENLMPSEVYMYSSICHGPWLYNGYKSKQKLCCDEGKYVHC
ncbi:uncharacterized protein LOC121871945 [Homarus americanus]|uniref:uncharacterized protein LOC121871945 n=1 Tax=Homarus americanus TaxID=6706 RepID=UPI001C45DDB4|nr:uncharacterized protein LOC121871945 [Homarus americanus]